jgi:hypothetical protein
MLTFHDTVANAFYEGWQHPKARPTIHNIFYVAYSGSGLTHLGKFSDYWYALIKLLKYSSDRLNSNKVGNTQMMFHGTKRSCTIADNPQKVVCCTASDCNLCCILRGSYNMERAKGGESPIFSLSFLYLFERFSSSLARMFGPGIYSSLVSSKADIYTKNANGSVRNQVMIINQVSLGRTKMAFEASHDMQHAPHLYNSVSRINHKTIFLAHLFFQHRLLRQHFRREAK